MRMDNDPPAKTKRQRPLGTAALGRDFGWEAGCDTSGFACDAMGDGGDNGTCVFAGDAIGDADCGDERCGVAGLGESQPAPFPIST